MMREISAQRRQLEELRSEIGDFRKSGTEPGRQFNDHSSETPSSVGSTSFSGPGDWCPRTVLVRGWAPFGSPAAQKIDRVEYKKVANELTVLFASQPAKQCYCPCLFCREFSDFIWLKNGGGFNSCRAVQEALSAGVEANMITVRGSWAQGID